MQSQDHDLDALAALVEDRLDESGRARVFEHLAGCDECRATLAAMTRAKGSGALPHLGRPGRSAWRGAPAWIGLAASVVLVAFVGVQFILPPAPPDDELLTRRGAERIVEGKTFRLESGTWTDGSFDAALKTPEVLVRGVDERAILLMNEPELAPFADLGERVVVVWKGNVYRFEP